MAAERIDARGLACPQPVIHAKKALEKIASGILEVLVDNQAAVENVCRLAENSGCQTERREDGDDFMIVITKNAESEVSREEVACAPSDAKGSSAILITAETIGKGDDELGRVLMKAMLPTLLEVEPKPGHMVFMNGGVKLTVEGSEYLEKLKALEAQGVELLVCGTCLDYFNMKDKLKVGRISNFYEIAETFLNAKSVVNF